MQEICYCGWYGELTDREPTLVTLGGWALRCPGCGHLDDLRWLPDDVRRIVLDRARGRQPATVNDQVARKVAI